MIDANKKALNELLKYFKRRKYTKMTVDRWTQIAVEYLVFLEKNGKTIDDIGDLLNSEGKVVRKEDFGVKEYLDLKTKYSARYLNYLCHVMKRLYKAWEKHFPIDNEEFPKVSGEPKRLMLTTEQLLKVADTAKTMWLEDVAKHRDSITGLRDYAIILLNVDSVPSYTPITLKDEEGNIDCQEIGDFWEATTSDIEVTERGEEIKKVTGFKTFVGHNSNHPYWKDIKYIIRHRYDGKLKLINVGGGIVEVTPTHSLIKRPNRIICASNVKIGEILVVPELKIKNGTLLNSYQKMFIGTEDLAWFFGFFCAEGSAYKYKQKDGTNYCITVSNNNKALLKKSKEIMEKNFHGKVSESVRHWKKYKDVTKLIIKSYPLYLWFRKNFHSGNGEKKIPKFILNAPDNIKYSFLKGYNAGDGGHSKRYKHEFQSFTSKSQVLSQGLLIMAYGLNGNSYIIYARDDKKNIIQIHFNGSSKKRIERNKINKIINKSYSGYVYDLSTDSERYCAGVGSIVVHNTGARRYQISQLNCDFYDGEKNILFIPAAKGGRDTYRPLSKVTRDVIIFYLKKREKVQSEEKAMFLSNNSEQRITVSSMSEIIQMITKRAGVYQKGIGFHAPRRGKSLRLKQAGLSEEERNDVFGWKTGSKMSHIYGELDHAEVQQKAADADTILKQKQSKTQNKTI